MTPIDSQAVHMHSKNLSRLSGSGLHTLSPTCFIRPKTTGLVSLFIQVVLIIVSGITSLFFFYHVGGYEYTHWNENSTILEPINHNIYSKNQQLVKDMKKLNYNDESLVSTADRNVELVIEKHNDKFNNSTALDSVFDLFESLSTPHDFIENASFGIEQVPMTTVIIGETEFDWLEVIRISTIVYIAICIGWMLSGLFFICSIRCELLDTVVLNMAILLLVVLFQATHAGLIASLIFFQREMSWRTMSITVGSIIIMFSCAFLGFVCLILNCGWVQYIDHVHGGKKCSMLYFCRGKKTNSTDENSVGRLPSYNIRQFGNDVSLNNFDAF